jgi:hypothetical protein
VTDSRATRRAAGAFVCGLAASALWSVCRTAAPASTGAGRACGEWDLVRYADPGNALDGQYADIKAA